MWEHFLGLRWFYGFDTVVHFQKPFISIDVLELAGDNWEKLAEWKFSKQSFSSKQYFLSSGNSLMPAERFKGFQILDQRASL